MHDLCLVTHKYGTMYTASVCYSMTLYDIVEDTIDPSMLLASLLLSMNALIVATTNMTGVSTIIIHFV